MPKVARHRARSTPGVAELPGIEASLCAGLRWLYRTVQPDHALVEPCGAHLSALTGRLRVVPLGAAGTPLIVVDADLPRWGAGYHCVALNPLPANGLTELAGQLAVLGVPGQAQHYHRLTGVLALDVPAHPSLRAAVQRYARGCPHHHGALCGRATSCAWRTEGRRAAIWPTAAAGEGDWR